MVDAVDGNFCASLPRATGNIFLGVWSEETDASNVVLAARFLLFGGPEPRLAPTILRAAQRFLDQHQPTEPKKPEPVPEKPPEPPQRARILAMLKERPLYQARIRLGMDNGDILENLGFSSGHLFQALSDLSIPEDTICQLIRGE